MLYAVKCESKKQKIEIWNQIHYLLKRARIHPILLSILHAGVRIVHTFIAFILLPGLKEWSPLSLDLYIASTVLS